MKKLYLVSVGLFLGTALISAGAEEEFGLTGPCSPEAQLRGKVPKECFELAVPEKANLKTSFQYGPKANGYYDMPPEEDEFEVQQTGPDSPPIDGDGDVDPTKIVNLFRWFWDFLQKNKAVVNQETFSFAHALPYGVESAESKELDWGDGEAQTISPSRPIVFKNLFGMPVITSHYFIQFVPGGKWRGQGQYLSNVAVIYGDHNVYPPFKMDVYSRVMAVLRFNSKKGPTAGIQLVVMHDIQGLNHISQTDSFVIKGDGSAREVRPDYFKSGK